MAEQQKPEPRLEIAHVLFIDIVGYSKLLIDEQRDSLAILNRIVRETEAFVAAEKTGQLTRLPTGDGMALVFRTTPDAPVRCAMQIAEALKSGPELPLRIGIHSGPVDAVSDVNDRPNIAGSGINMAQRVMDCADAGHILLSKRAADDLAHYAEWRPRLHELGEIEIKHGVRLNVTNLYFDGIGRPTPPERFRRAARAKQRRKILGLAAAVLILLGAGAGWLFFPRGANLFQGERGKSIAVLPLENLSDDKENAFFADGIQEDILSSLAKISDLKVISRTSVMQYRAGAGSRNLSKIGRELGVQNVVEGSVRRAGNRVLVNVQLIDAEHDQHLWAERYDRTIADSIGLQGELATEIANALRAKLAPEEKARLATKPTTSSEAYVLYLKANERVRLAHSKEDGIEADQMYTQAMALDSAFALAVARASMLNSKMYEIGRDPTRAQRARNLAEEALRLSPGLGDAHLAMALCFTRIDRNDDAALKELSLAAAVMPNNAEISEISGSIHGRQGHWREALASAQRAQDLDPRNQHPDAAGIHVLLRDWPGAITAFERLRQVDPDNQPRSVWATIDLAYVEFYRTGDLSRSKEILRNIPAGVDPNARVTYAKWDFSMMERDFAAAEKVLIEYPSEEFPPPMRNPKSYFQGCTALARGDTALAQSLLEKARPIFELRVHDHPDDPVFLAPLGKLYAFLGRKEDALRASRRAVELMPESKYADEGPGYAGELAVVCARVGEDDQAIPLIERLLSTPGGLILAELRLRWEWDPLRANPRFKQILDAPEPKTVY
jgi:TolB-like protein/Flp pilus assembly protein TadD